VTFRELKIAPTLTLSVGFLVLLAVGLVLYVQWNASRKIMTELAGRVVIRNLEMVSQGISGHLDPVRNQVEYLADLVEKGVYDIDGKARLADLLIGAVASSPQFGGVFFLGSDGLAVRVRRGINGRRYDVDFPNLGRVLSFQAVLKKAQGEGAGYWADLVYNRKIDTTFINYRRPLRKNGRFVGLIAAAVTIKDLSKLVSDLSDIFGNTTFLMYGEDKVLAHPRLLTEPFPRSESEPAVSVERLGDRVISGLGRAVPSKFADLSDQKNARIHELEADGIAYFVLRKSLHQYGDLPFVIGIYRVAGEVNAPLRLLYTSGLIGLIILVIALLVAALLSHKIAAPIRRVTDGVMKVGQLSFADVQPIPGAWIKEVGDLARSFNGMLGGLQSFETYVPRKLVQRLIKQEGSSEIVSEERELTVMFTDIADFTAMCEGMTATEVADFINEHLTLLAECVEDEGGTIDKYIGDALMAFWGAPEPIENSAEKACRAARKIAIAMAKENEIRAAKGKALVRLRVGVHTGPLVVGNIGAPSRINYTVVGDTVNTTQRLEALGKEIAPHAEVIVLMSEKTASGLPTEFQTKPAGSFHVKGRMEPVAVHQLIL
jgi:adenylate cyclase